MLASAVHGLPRVLLLGALLVQSAGAQTRPPAPGALAPHTPHPSRLIEVSGRVELRRANQDQWQAAHVGDALAPGDRLRTRAESRAALQLSDRSVIRLDERTTLELQRPRSHEKRRFRLSIGSLFFFNREGPAEVAFETPLVTGAIRGTEFVLSAAADQSMRLALLDGAVALRTPTQTLELHSGEQVEVAPGQPARQTALIDAVRLIQWALYYPAVLSADDLPLTDADRAAFAEALALYGQGDVLGALASAPEPDANRPPQLVLRAALELSVGRVDTAEERLARVPPDTPGVAALRELIEAVRPGGSQGTGAWPEPALNAPTTASGWLARSYRLQAQFQLEAALAAGQQAVAMAPHFGFAHARVAELEFALNRRRAALAALERALARSPRLAPALALRGFVQLEDHQPRRALASFEQALQLDSALGLAWLGRGLAEMRLGRRGEAVHSLQAAAALEPQRSLFRSYLGKAFSEHREPRLAEKEFRLARQLDPNDPTPWFYDALHLWQQNRFNEAIQQLEASADRNDQRSVFRSRLGLDRDLAVRSANLAALYADAGLADVSRHAAARSVSEDYANFSSHLFLANAYQALEDPQRFNLRFETARHSELLLANLLSPPGGGNLSQVVSQQDPLRFFDPRPFGLSSFTEYRSAGDWRQVNSAFGTVNALSYAVDTVYESQTGQRPHADLERWQLSLQLKQRLTASDSAYAQIGWFDSKAADLARYYDPAEAKAGFRVAERQEPTAYLGWHHEWAPGQNTLVLLSRLHDRLNLVDPRPNVLFVRHGGGGVAEVSTPPGFELQFDSEFTLYSTEVQQVWQTRAQTLIAGARYQHGDVTSDAQLNRTLTGTITDQQLEEPMQRGTGYLYQHWRLADSLRWIVGLSYDHLTFPQNSDLAPLTAGQSARDLLAPKAGLVYAPWQRGVWRASYTRSLGGLFFDNSVRLEPTQIAGFNQAFRSLLPESRAGLVPGTRFDTAAVGFDQALAGGTYFGVEAEWLHSEGDRTVGVFTNSTFLPIPDAPASTAQSLEFRERNLSAYAAQLLGEACSVGVRYRLSEARLHGRFPAIPTGTPGLDAVEQQERSVLHELSLFGNFHHRSGVFARWESTWYRQSNRGYTPDRPGDNFWQHNVWLGYRLPRRALEVQCGLLNLTGDDYRLNPLNLYTPLPRERTLVVQLRWTR